MEFFRDKVVLITGSTGGLGRVLARKLAEAGALLVMTGRTDEALAELRNSLSAPQRATTIEGYLTDPAEAPRLARTAEAVHGRVDVLINNAGIGYFALVEEATDERVRELFELDTFAPLTLMRLLAPGMKARGAGKIVNVASAAGRVLIPTVGIYGGSQSALAIMANTMRLELEPHGVDVINVYPGTTCAAFEINALRENNRGGLYGFNQYAGRPVDEIADQILGAIPGPSREVWLEREGRWMAAGALLVPGWVDRKLRPLRDRALAFGEHGKSHEDRRWRLWQVETSLRRNLECVMCPWPEFRAAAGAFLGEKALYTAATVKMIQNVLIGVVAFFVALIWTTKIDRTVVAQVSPMEIWYRFPKFVIGFVVASITFSLIYQSLGADVGSAMLDNGALSGWTKIFRGWFFCLAFVSIGLATNFRELAHYFKGGKPLILYVSGQSFNLCLTLFMAWLMFYKVFPDITAKL